MNVISSKSLSSVKHITINDYDDYRIFQRMPGKQIGSIPVSGTCTDSPSSIQARILNFVDSTEIVGWSELSSLCVADSTFEGVLENVPCGGWYKLEVRQGDETNIVACSKSHFAVGIIIAVAGQSNAELLFHTHGSRSADMPNEFTRKFVLGEGWRENTGFGACALGNKLWQELQMPIGLLHCGLEFSALVYPNKISNGYWSQYDKELYLMFKRSLDAVGNKIEFLLWIQGESDAFGNQSMFIYKETLRELFERIKVDSWSSVTFLIIALGRNVIYPDMNIDGRAFANIRQAQVDFCEENPDAFLAATCMDVPVAHEGCHWPIVKEGATTVMHRVANTILYTLNRSSYYRGPRFAHFKVVSPKEIHVSIQHSGGTDFSGSVDWFLVGGERYKCTATKLNENTVKLSGNLFSEETILGYQHSGSLQYELTEYAPEKDIAKDNSPLRLPIEHAKRIPFMPTPKIEA